MVTRRRRQWRTCSGAGASSGPRITIRSAPPAGRDPCRSAGLTHARRAARMKGESITWTAQDDVTHSIIWAALGRPPSTISRSIIFGGPSWAPFQERWPGGSLCVRVCRSVRRPAGRPAFWRRPLFLLDFMHYLSRSLHFHLQLPRAEATFRAPRASPPTFSSRRTHTHTKRRAAERWRALAKRVPDKRPAGLAPSKARLSGRRPEALAR
jgi:hypothetical protein